MSNKEEKRGKLSKEILGLFGATAAISVFFFGFLSVTANSIMLAYCERNNIVFTESVEWTVDVWIQSVSFMASVFLFVFLFLVLVGQKISYLKEIIRGVDALRTHRMDYVMPVEGNNELTELAESINYLSKTERELNQKIRALSHDIRTPLTSILSYSEYMEDKEEISKEEMISYIALVRRKAEQIKILTDKLLDGGRRNLEKIENGKMLMLQLAEEWEAALEDEFECEIDLEKCPDFSGEVDIQEIRRVFDNLASNVEKYADSGNVVELQILKKKDGLAIVQRNRRKEIAEGVESYKIGIESVRRIAEHYGGRVNVDIGERDFVIEIILSSEFFRIAL